MYIWRLSPLRAELARAPLPPLEAMRYALAGALLLSAASYVPNGLETLDALTTALLIASLVIVTAGVWLVYRANGAGAGQDFAGRYLALGWVVAVRTFVLLLVVLPVMLVVAALLGAIKTPFDEGHFDKVFGATGAVIVLGAECWYYWRLQVHMARVAAATSFQVQVRPEPNPGAA